MPSLARVMPVISLVIAGFLPIIIALDRYFAGAQLLGVTVAVVLEHLLGDFGLELSVRPLGHFGQVEVLDRIAVAVELEIAAQRG
jgi:hypothetical protein